jgi:hypothetical protein
MGDHLVFLTKELAMAIKKITRVAVRTIESRFSSNDEVVAEEFNHVLKAIEDAGGTTVSTEWLTSRDGELQFMATYQVEVEVKS